MSAIVSTATYPRSTLCPFINPFLFVYVSTASFNSTSIRASILGEDFKVTSESPHTRCNMCIRPYSDGMGFEDLNIPAILIVICFPGYLHKCPNLRIMPEKNLSKEDTGRLLSHLIDQSLRSGGIRFPGQDDESLAPIFTPLRSVPATEPYSEANRSKVACTITDDAGCKEKLAAHMLDQLSAHNVTRICYANRKGKWPVSD